MDGFPDCCGTAEHRTFPELNEFQPSRWPQPAKSEQSANLTTYRLSPGSEWKAFPEPVCTPGLVCLSPRPSVQAAIAPWPESHKPRQFPNRMIRLPLSHKTIG